MLENHKVIKCNNYGGFGQCKWSLNCRHTTFPIMHCSVKGVGLLNAGEENYLKEKMAEKQPETEQNGFVSYLFSNRCYKRDNNVEKKHERFLNLNCYFFVRVSLKAN